jgi:hypothetical protein
VCRKEESKARLFMESPAPKMRPLQVRGYVSDKKRISIKAIYENV